MQSTWVSWAGAALVALSTAACGDGGTTGAAGNAGTAGSAGTGGAAGSAGTGGTGGGSNVLSCDGQPEVLDLAGTWAAYGALTVAVSGQPGSLVSVCPADQEGQAFLTMFITIGQDSADPKTLKDVKATLCTVDLPAVTAVAGTCDPSSNAVTTQISVPDALLNAFPLLATMTVGGTLSDTKVGSDVALDKFVVTAGSSKSGAMLPVWDPMAMGCGDSSTLGHTSLCEDTCVSDCAGLKDDDGDLYPGITLAVCGRTQDDKGKPCNTEIPTDPGVTIQGRAFAALEVDPQFSGKATSSCQLTGTVTTNVKYTVVGADVTLTGSPISVASALSALPTLTVKPAQSKLSFVRVDGKYGSPDLKLGAAGALTACKTIIANKNDLF